MKTNNESKDFITWILDLFKPHECKDKYELLPKDNNDINIQFDILVGQHIELQERNKKLKKSDKTLLLGNRILNFNYEELGKEVFSLKQKCANLKNQNTELFKALEEARKENYVNGDMKG